MEITIPAWALWTLAAVIGIPTLVLIGFCVYFTRVFFKNWKR